MVRCAIFPCSLTVSAGSLHPSTSSHKGSLYRAGIKQAWNRRSIYSPPPTSFVMISLLGTRKLIDMASRDNKKPCGQQGHRPLAAREQQERSILFLKACTSRAGQERGEMCLPQPTRRGKALVSKAFAYQRD